jgi:hypothetical protein
VPSHNHFTSCRRPSLNRPTDWIRDGRPQVVKPVQGWLPAGCKVVGAGNQTIQINPIFDTFCVFVIRVILGTEKVVNMKDGLQDQADDLWE